MINFCHPVMNSTITCSTVCTDGYEITNLISKDPNLQRKGFIAYHAIRPPVTAELNFVCNVNVSEVVLLSEVGSQRSTGFELYAASGCSCTADGTCRCKKIFPSNYEKIAFAFLNGCERGVIFTRGGKVVASRVDTSNLVHCTFFGGKRAVLENVHSLVIKIIRTSSLPCLARVEVWGQPSSSSDATATKKATALWEQRIAQVTVNKTVDKRSDYDKNSTDEYEDCSFKIPEEFLDPITCKLMALPMTLPSGKVVDQSTLNKFEHYEATWGRSPSDPYTGRVFTDSCHPILATSLKARIDKFLIEHANVPEVKTAPRTVGRKIPSAAATSSCYQKPSSVANVTTEKTVKETKLFYTASSEEHGAKKKQRVGPSLSLNHEERLSRSLRSAVKNVLAGLPSFTKFEDMEIKPEDCTECHSKVILYKLPCTHLVCRNCLVQKQTSNNLKCAACSAEYRSNDPVRHFS